MARIDRLMCYLKPLDEQYEHIYENPCATFMRQEKQSISVGLYGEGKKTFSQGR